MSGTQDSKLERILEELSSMKSKMPNGELKVIQSSIEELKHSQADIKSDVSEMKRRLLDPESGVVVRLNQNTQYIEDKKELEDYYEEIIDQHKELLSFKNTMTKAMWIVFTALVGILTKMMFFTNASLNVL
jgi:DNA repair exonuclease SbcCD ATPase subunit